MPIVSRDPQEQIVIRKQLMAVENVVWIGAEIGRFIERLIIGETSRSWITIAKAAADRRASEWYIQRYATKLPKNGKNWFVVLPFEAELSNWAIGKHWEIAGAVQRTHDVDILIALARILKMDVPERKL